MDEHDAAWERASLLLEAHAQISDSQHHPNDAPSAVIERLLTDLMHYAHERNKGKPDDSGEYIHFDRMVAIAREQFIKEREAVPERDEPLLDPYRPRPSVEFLEMQTKLYSRQLAERQELERKQQAELNHLGPSQELSDRHTREWRDQVKEFEKERERYLSEYLESKRLAREIEEREKQKGVELDEDEKFSR